MAAVLYGKVDGIILTGRISYAQYVVQVLTEMLSFIAPIEVMVGEFENGGTGSRRYPGVSGE